MKPPTICKLTEDGWELRYDPQQWIVIRGGGGPGRQFYCASKEGLGLILQKREPTQKQLAEVSDNEKAVSKRVKAGRKGPRPSRKLQEWEDWPLKINLTDEARQIVMGLPKFRQDWTPPKTADDETTTAEVGSG
jgi:hypothetical protein